MDTWDLVALVLFLGAGLGMAWMMWRRPARDSKPWERTTVAGQEVYTSQDLYAPPPDRAAWRAWVRAERSGREVSTEEPRIITPERLAAWRAEQKAKRMPTVIICKGQDAALAVKFAEALAEAETPKGA